jgi:hypothetical protein
VSMTDQLASFRARAERINLMVGLLTDLHRTDPENDAAAFQIEVSIMEPSKNASPSRRCSPLSQEVLCDLFNRGRKYVMAEIEKELESLLAVEPERPASE